MQTITRYTRSLAFALAAITLLGLACGLTPPTVTVPVQPDVNAVETPLGLAAGTTMPPNPVTTVAASATPTSIETFQIGVQFPWFLPDTPAAMVSHAQEVQADFVKFTVLSP